MPDPTTPAERDAIRREVRARFIPKDPPVGAADREAAAEAHRQIDLAARHLADTAETIVDTTVPSREQGQALEHLELALFWARRALERYGRAPEPRDRVPAHDTMDL